MLPHLGFEQVSEHVWRDAAGLHFQFRQANTDTRDYERYGPGLNHFGFAAPSAQFVEAVHAAMTTAGYEARLQTFGDGVVALFMPDPDGLRVELSYYPPGVSPVM